MKVLGRKAAQVIMLCVMDPMTRNICWWISTKGCSADTEKSMHSSDMDQLDRVPVDFSAPTGPTIMTDPDEVEEILLRGESRAIYEKHSKIYGLASCSMYRAERWFHYSADQHKVERMLLRTGVEDGYVPIINV
uniref:Uncharacterized protein n=1 Tax=Setaria digitata TaxID=48799 RepID=A0A915PBV2_9BILA